MVMAGLSKEGIVIPTDLQGILEVMQDNLTLWITEDEGIVSDPVAW